MENISPYFYYSKFDYNKKEPIDKVLAFTKENAIEFFANRKNIDINEFNKLYNVEIYAQTQPK